MKKSISKGSWFSPWISTETIEEHYEGKIEALELEDYYPGISLTDLRSVMPMSPIKREFIDDRHFEEEPLPEGLEFDKISLCI